MKMTQPETKRTECKMVEVPISDDLYKFLETAGSEKGMTASEYAQKLVLENLDRLKEIAKDLAIKTLTTLEEEKP